MITYVDTSTLIKLIIAEDGSERAEVVWATADSVASVELIVVESRAALAAAARDSRITTTQHRRAKALLTRLVDDLHIVVVDRDLLVRASDLSEDEALRAYDAVHLAGALLVGAAVFSSADRLLCAAAAHQGLHIANPLQT